MVKRIIARNRARPHVLDADPFLFQIEASRLCRFVHRKVCSAVRFRPGDQSTAPTADLWHLVGYLTRDGFNA